MGSVIEGFLEVAETIWEIACAVTACTWKYVVKPVLWPVQKLILKPLAWLIFGQCVRFKGTQTIPQERNSLANKRIIQLKVKGAWFVHDVIAPLGGLCKLLFDEVPKHWWVDIQTSDYQWYVTQFRYVGKKGTGTSDKKNKCEILGPFPSEYDCDKKGKSCATKYNGTVFEYPEYHWVYDEQQELLIMNMHFVYDFIIRSEWNIYDLGYNNCQDFAKKLHKMFIKEYVLAIPHSKINCTSEQCVGESVGVCDCWDYDKYNERISDNTVGYLHHINGNEFVWKQEYPSKTFRTRAKETGNGYFKLSCDQCHTHCWSSRDWLWGFVCDVRCGDIGHHVSTNRYEII
eukprot:536485_1